MRSGAKGISVVSRERVGGVWGSRWFAGCVSLAAHAVLFAAFAHIILWRGEVPASTIVPEALLGPPAQRPSAGRTAPEPTEREPVLPAEPRETPPVLDPGRFEESPLHLPPVEVGDISFAAPTPERAPGESTTAGTNVAASVVRASAAIGPRTGFFGVTGNAHKVVYVVDTTASLELAVQPLQEELIASIRGLRPNQWFHVITAGDRIRELAARRLVPAIRSCKDSAVVFIKAIVPDVGRCPAVAAMQRALAVEPELIYFLSDGDFPKGVRVELLEKLRRWNANKQVKITTIGFSVAGAGYQGEALLKQLAREHGGNYRVVDIEEALRASEAKRRRNG